MCRMAAVFAWSLESAALSKFPIVQVVTIEIVRVRTWITAIAPHIGATRSQHSVSVLP